MTAINMSIKNGQELIKIIREISGQNPYLCMQCGICSAGCTGRGYMDRSPRQIVRMIQMGDFKTLSSKSAWVCSTCLICTARCPRGIDIARLMEALRVISQRQGNEALVVEEIPAELVEQVPQIALIGGFRKLSV
ncbi:heterodisulfide reductase subunit C [Desulfotomaculum arcticum]|uniref:Heterodisulfide reductase subunit C n=1 Tax=Desulfotruncus arcticus DSM 17038 TaxID=1121424 RepID=A0A1I2WMU6_9FIRM|nr:4Fe-4S dicluster domain-containing protein [Desulfotruncus arcticus]SFH02512.1 heterodisulfide reductase subunit C [Desulfotomaculum arcticum] [Desulfotruncus arcticus DSM 17038]